MSTGTTKKALTGAQDKQARQRDWQAILFWAIIGLLFVIAIAMRLYQLGLPFDRDSYDEGVYWQSLRAMAAGHALYSDIFYSQPPLFLLSTYPIYALFGASLWSARLGIALVSLFGLVGAFLLGKALSGRVGAIAALLLAVVDPLFLAQSQTIQAEASSTAFSFLAIGLALYWFKYPTGKRGLLLAILTGVTVALSIMCKLLGAALLAPIVLLMLARLWLGVGDALPPRRGGGWCGWVVGALAPPASPYVCPNLSPIYIRNRRYPRIPINHAHIDPPVFRHIPVSLVRRCDLSYRRRHRFERRSTDGPIEQHRQTGNRAGNAARAGRSVRHSGSVGAPRLARAASARLVPRHSLFIVAAGATLPAPLRLAHTAARRPGSHGRCRAGNLYL